MARTILGSTAAIALIACSASLCPAADQGGALEPRYAIDATRLDAVPSHDSGDGRYRLDARLRHAETQQAGIGISLNAKLVSSATTACDASSLIFTDGFE